MQRHGCMLKELELRGAAQTSFITEGSRSLTRPVRPSARVDDELPVPRHDIEGQHHFGERARVRGNVRHLRVLLRGQRRRGDPLNRLGGPEVGAAVRSPEARYNPL